MGRVSRDVTNGRMKFRDEEILEFGIIENGPRRRRKSWVRRKLCSESRHGVH